MTTITSDTVLLHTDHHVRVVAGPGAGKTYWLAEHVGNVIRRSTKLHSYARIAVISYTNIAADELRAKLGPDAVRTDIRTIHSFLYANLLRPYIYLLKDNHDHALVNSRLMDGHDEHHVNHRKLEAWLGLVNYRAILRDQSQVRILKEVLATIRWNQADDPTQWALDVKPQGWLAQQLWRPTRAKLTNGNLAAYKRLYWEDGVLDHDDVLYFATRILHEHPFLSSFLSARYPFLFIDEFQDTVPAQTNILRLLAAQGSTVVVIGDTEQSIFTFAGAHPEHFRTFMLPGIDEYAIAHNRRSSDRIIELLNHVRSDGLRQHGVRKERGDVVRLIVGAVPDVTRYVQALVPETESLLIVARTGRVAQEAQLPSALPTDNPWDNVETADNDRRIFLQHLFAGVLLARQRRFDAAVTTILRGIRHTNGRLKEPLQSTILRSAQQRRSIAVTLVECLLALGSTFDQMTLHIAYDHCRNMLATSFQGLTLRQIRAGRFQDIADHCVCEALLCSVKLTNNEEVRDARTIHQAKGTERPNVLVCLTGRRLEDTQDRLNHILNPNDVSDEEHRITYVAISRARDRLFLQVPTLTSEQEARAQDLGLEVIRLAAE